jgi:fermentation-respiration switch protein FrsA (DUF1100 family)
VGYRTARAASTASASEGNRAHVPLLVAHGDEDEVVPYALGEALFAAAGEPKRFLHLPGAHHNDVFE